jgi:hypothetical protein
MSEASHRLNEEKTVRHGGREKERALAIVI